MTWSRARLSAAVALAACVAPASAAAAGVQILLPSVRTSLTPGPPLTGTNPATTEVLFPPGMTSDQRVSVGVDSTGKPVSIGVLQRLVLHNLGDYSFAVSGPIEDVEAAPGSDSEPGLRRDAILWSGFSSGKKTLASRATLRVPPAAAVLPLRVSIAREGNALVLRGENTSAAPGPLLVGPVAQQEAVRALDETRRRLALGRGAPDLYVNVPRNPLSQSEQIAAPLDVRGELGGRRFAYRLGDGGPMVFELRVPHAGGGARLRLVVTPVPPSRLLARTRVPGSQLLEHVSRVRLTVARELQYQTFLANPNVTGSAHAVYVYETAKKAAAPPAASSAKAVNDAWLTALIAALAVLGATGLVVLWAHS